MTAYIMGLGQWLPETVRQNDAWPPSFWEAAVQRAGDRTLVDIDMGGDSEYARRIADYFAAEAGDPFLGTRQRRVADAAVGAREAELRAARAALDDAGVPADAVDCVMSWSMVPDQLMPPSALWVASAVGAHRAWAAGMDAACASIIPQLACGAALISSGQARYVLLTQSHLMTRVFPMSHPASPNVGDAATAVVLGPKPGHAILGSHAVSEGQYFDGVTWTRSDGDTPWYAPGGGYCLGSRDRAMAQELVRETVRMGSRTIADLMERIGLPVSALAAVVSVQPRRWVPGAIAEALGLPAGRAPHTFDELAHLAAAGVVTNLIAARQRALLAPGSLVALYAQGAGFTRGATVVRW